MKWPQLWSFWVTLNSVEVSGKSDTTLCCVVRWESRETESLCNTGSLGVFSHVVQINSTIPKSISSLGVTITKLEPFIQSLKDTIMMMISYLYIYPYMYLDMENSSKYLFNDILIRTKVKVTEAPKWLKMGPFNSFWNLAALHTFLTSEKEYVCVWQLLSKTNSHLSAEQVSPTLWMLFRRDCLKSVSCYFHFQAISVIVTAFHPV